MVIKWGIWYNLSDRVLLYINMPNTKHIYNMIELIDKEKIRGRKMSDIKVSIIMPVYKVEEYVGKAIESIQAQTLTEWEFIIVDDGTPDKSGEICDAYAEKDNRIKVIHKENGGHGSAVNTGIANATGLYFKVLDSDDWFDKTAMLKLIKFLRQSVVESMSLDMIIANYVYEKPSAHKRKAINYNMAIPKNKIITWSDVKHFRMSQNLLMHSIIYKTKLLRDCNLHLPEHTFYVDNIYAYTPLPYVKKMYYLNIDLYRYYIGREGQSVNEAIMTKRIDQQIKVTKLMIDSQDLMSIHDKKLRNYMIKYLTMITTVSTVLMIKSGTAENLQKKNELWHYLKVKNKTVYRIITHRKLGLPLQSKNRAGRKIIVWGYYFFNRIYGFN